MQNIFEKYLPNMAPQWRRHLKILWTHRMWSHLPRRIWNQQIRQTRSMLGVIRQLTDMRPDIACKVSKFSHRQCTPRVIYERHAVCYQLLVQLSRPRSSIASIGDVHGAIVDEALRPRRLQPCMSRQTASRNIACAKISFSISLPPP